MVVLACGDIDSRYLQWNRWGPHAGRKIFPRSPQTQSWARHFVETVNDWDFYHHIGPDEPENTDSAHDGAISSDNTAYPRIPQHDRRVPDLGLEDIRIDVSDVDDHGQLARYWIKRLHLTDVDRSELLNWEMLSDKHVLAAQKLLSEQFSHIAGLQDPCLSQTSFESVERDSVQIHHTRGNHWVVTSWCEGDIVEVYDTLYSNVAPDLLRQMDEIYARAPRDGQGRLMYRMCPVHKQHGYRDCGLFSIALAYELCQGFDVRDVTFKQWTMRKHLEKCFEQQAIESFPMV